MNNSINNQLQYDCQHVEQPAHDKIYTRIYERLIKEEGWEYKCVRYEDDKEGQRKGIDVKMTTPWKEVIYFDEKARKLYNTHTFGLELSCNYENKEGKVGPRVPGWFIDETKVTDCYLFYYKEEDGEFVMLVNAHRLKAKIYSLIDMNVLMNTPYDGILSQIAEHKIVDGAKIIKRDDQREHGRFLILPLSFYHSIEGTNVYKIEN